MSRDDGFDGELLRDVPLTAPALNRRADLRGDPALVPTLLADPATRVLDIAHGTAPGDVDPPGLHWRGATGDDAERLCLYLGEAGGASYVAVVHPDRWHDQPDWLGLRDVGADLSPLDAEALTTAAGLANWHTTHPYCSRCGTATTPDNAGWTRRCPADGSTHFPRTDPAVIMAVLDADDRILLARGPSWPPGRLSVLAGFVEPGETLAAAVRREVREEVGVTLAEVRYLGDQPWPFPNSLMLGFEARAASTALTLDAAEIAEAHWVTRAEYTAKVTAGEWLAGTSLSISRRLVQRWLDGGRKDDGSGLSRVSS